MEKEIENLVNAWYKEWLQLNDPFEEDFESELYRVIPNVKMTFSPSAHSNPSRWLFLSYDL